MFASRSNSASFSANCDLLFQIMEWITSVTFLPSPPRALVTSFVRALVDDPPSGLPHSFFILALGFFFFVFFFVFWIFVMRLLDLSLLLVEDLHFQVKEVFRSSKIGETCKGKRNGFRI